LQFLADIQECGHIYPTVYTWWSSCLYEKTTTKHCGFSKQFVSPSACKKKKKKKKENLYFGFLVVFKKGGGKKNP